MHLHKDFSVATDMPLCTTPTQNSGITVAELRPHPRGTVR